MSPTDEGRKDSTEWQSLKILFTSFGLRECETDVDGSSIFADNEQFSDGEAGAFSPVNISPFSRWIWLTFPDPHQKQTEKDFGQHFCNNVWCPVLALHLKYNIAIWFCIYFLLIHLTTECLLEVNKRIS